MKALRNRISYAGLQFRRAVRHYKLRMNLECFEELLNRSEISTRPPSACHGVDENADCRFAQDSPSFSSNGHPGAPESAAMLSCGTSLGSLFEFYLAIHSLLRGLSILPSN